MHMICICAETVPVRTVNRQCSSGLQAVADVAAAIRAGFYDIGNSFSGCLTIDMWLCFNVFTFLFDLF